MLANGIVTPLQISSISVPASALGIKPAINGDFQMSTEIYVTKPARRSLRQTGEGKVNLLFGHTLKKSITNLVPVI